RLPLRLRRTGAFAFGEGGPGGGDGENRQGAEQLHQGLQVLTLRTFGGDCVANVSPSDSRPNRPDLRFQHYQSPMSTIGPIRRSSATSETPARRLNSPP